jgi:hypothetical protein
VLLRPEIVPSAERVADFRELYDLRAMVC